MLPRPPFVAVLAALAFASLPSAQVRFGAMGDSSTDEYSYWAGWYGDSGAKNWVDLMGELRGPSSPVPELDLGSYRFWDSFGPRFTGFGHNWAESGATTSSLINDGQHTGIASLGLDLVFVQIGYNDIWGAYGSIYNGGNPSALIDGMASRITQAVDTVAGPPGAPTGTKLVLSTIESMEVVDGVTTSWPDPVKRARVEGVVQAVNARILALGAARSIPVVDLWSLIPLHPATNFTVGGVTLSPGGPSSPDPSYFYLPDSFHYSTVVQGIYGNAAICAANLGHCMNLRQLSDQEILGAAGVTGYDPMLKTYFDLAPYVILNGPPCPSAWADLGNALGGTHGDPALAGAGTPTAGKLVSLALTNALESTLAPLAFSTSRLDLALLGGVLVPTPQYSVTGFTDAAGALTTTFTTPAGLPSGAQFFFQHVVVDPLAPQSVAYSNAIELTVP